MDMVKFTLLTIFCLSRLAAADFSLTIGNPIAANIPRMKTAGLAVRLENCADLSKSSLTGTGEGFSAGARKSVPLQIVAGAAPGVYAVGLGEPLDGPGSQISKQLAGASGRARLCLFGASFSSENPLKSFLALPRERK